MFPYQDYNQLWFNSISSLKRLTFTRRTFRSLFFLFFFAFPFMWFKTDYYGLFNENPTVDSKKGSHFHLWTIPNWKNEFEFVWNWIFIFELKFRIDFVIAFMVAVEIACPFIGKNNLLSGWKILKNLFLRKKKRFIVKSNSSTNKKLIFMYQLI